ncbi:MAG: hypothetical protein ABI658_06415 [Acidimicrobiales bacterium]
MSIKGLAVIIVVLAIAACGGETHRGENAPNATTPISATAASTTAVASPTTASPTTASPTTASPTTAPLVACSAPTSYNIGGGIVVVPPVGASLKCEAGWRMFGWIGQSGDGILLIQHVAGASWSTDYYGPGCGGVASAPSDELVKSGLPKALADKWGGGCGR